MGEIRKYAPRRRWTKEEEEHLRQLSERYTKADVARIMNRTPASVNAKRIALGIGGLMDMTERWNMKQVAEAVGMYKTTIGRDWVKAGLKTVKRKNYRLVEEKELHRFMRANPYRWDATKCDYYLFYQFPWFLEKLEMDKQNPPNNVRKRWTEYEKQQFEYLKKRGFTHKEIAEKLGKTKGAIDHMSRLRNLEGKK